MSYLLGSRHSKEAELLLTAANKPFEKLCIRSHLLARIQLELGIEELPTLTDKKLTILKTKINSKLSRKSRREIVKEPFFIFIIFWFICCPFFIRNKPYEHLPLKQLQKSDNSQKYPKLIPFNYFFFYTSSEKVKKSNIKVRVKINE